MAIVVYSYLILNIRYKLLEVELSAFLASVAILKIHIKKL